MLNIGPRLRSAREAAGISLRTLGRRTGFSASFISQVELEQSSPSLASLQRICSALGITLGDLLQEPSAGNGAPVLRRKERERLRSEWSKATAESLTPTGTDDRMRAVLIVLDPGGRTGSIHRASGARELAYCIRGRVTLTVGEQRHQLGPGDSVLLSDAAATSWENDGTSRAEVILVTAHVS